MPLLLFAGVSTLATGSWAAPDCRPAFEMPLPVGFSLDGIMIPLRPGSYYRFQLVGHHEILVWQYLGSEVTEQGELLNLRLIKGGQTIDLTIPRSSIVAWKFALAHHAEAQDLSFQPAPPAEELSWLKKLWNKYQRLVKYRERRGFVIKPFHRLARNSHTDIYGYRTSAVDEAQGVLAQLLQIDEAFLGMGLTQPESSRVYLPKNKKELIGDGPFAIPYPILNIWSPRQRQWMMALMPYSTDVEGLHIEQQNDISILAHERAHHFLHRTFGYRDYINLSKLIQESFADYLASVATNSPEILPLQNHQGRPVRDISTRAYFDSETQTFVVDDHLLRVSEPRYHRDSLFVSHLLWRLENLVGRQFMELNLKSLIEALNSYAPSYQQLLVQENQIKVDSSSLPLREIEFFIAALLKESRSWPAASQVEMLIADYVQEIHYSMARITHVADQLVPMSPAVTEISREEEEKKRAQELCVYSVLSYADDLVHIAVLIKMLEFFFHILF